MLFSIFIIFLAFSGFLLSFYIRHKKSRPEKMVCPLRGDCKQVITSAYSRFLGVPVEVMGMLYYGFIALGYGFFVAFPAFHVSLLAELFLMITFCAALFSLYLTFLQVFILRQLCTWCLTSAGISLTLFIVAFVDSFDIVIPYLVSFSSSLEFAFLFASAFGFGVSLLGNILYIYFLRDAKISLFEAEVQRIVTQVEWVCIMMVVVAFVGLFLPFSSSIFGQPLFLLQVLALVCVIFSGLYIDLRITPLLFDPALQKPLPIKKDVVRIWNRSFFFLLISVISWFVLFVSTALVSGGIDVRILLALYGVLVLGCFIVSWLLRIRFMRGLDSAV